MNTKILLMFLFGLGVAESKFDEDVKAFFETFSGKGWHSCIKKANDKMSSYDGDRKYAVGIINVYTQNCRYNSDNNIFYETLNENMRSESPEEKWKTAGDLINRAIDIVGTQYFPTVYRGCSHDPGHLEDKYNFNQITSTSRNAGKAGEFACNGTLFILKHVRGADISSYSAFGPEAEVLVKSTVLFKVVKNPVMDATEIENIKNGFFNNPTRVIYIEAFADCGPRRRKRDNSNNNNTGESCQRYDNSNVHASGVSINDGVGTLTLVVIGAVLASFSVAFQ